MQSTHHSLSSVPSTSPRVGQAIWVTELGSKVQAYETTNVPPGVRSGSQHVLVVGPHFREPKTSAEIQRIQDLVQQDGKTNPPIDSVVFRRIKTGQGDVYSPFQDLRPRTLVVECVDYSQLEEEHGSERLSVLTPHWPIEHLSVSNHFCWMESGGWCLPSFGETVTSLVLNSCTGLMATTTKFQKLREVTILDGHACSIFSDLIYVGIEDPSSLKIARIQNAYSGHDFVGSVHKDEFLFINALTECSGLAELELHTYLDLVSVHDGYSEDEHLSKGFPPTLKHLHFRGPPSPGKLMGHQLLTHKHIWRQLAADPKWLPNLEMLTFRQDHTGDQGERTRPRSSDLGPEVNEFLDMFKQSHPSVQIDDSWYKVSLPP